MNVGYARVLIDEQNLAVQRVALEAAGCEPVFKDHSGMAVRSPDLDQTLARQGTDFHSLTENIDTTTAGERLHFHMLGALAEFERALIIEQTRAGMKVAKARGIKVGRKRTLTPVQISHTRQLVEQGQGLVAIPRFKNWMLNILSRPDSPIAKV